MKLLKLLPISLILALALCLSGCGSEEAAPNTVPQETVPGGHLAAVVTVEDLAQMDKYTNLKSLDLSGSTCYDAILRYMESHPDIAVTYTIPLGGASVPNTQAEITLNPGEYTADALLSNLPYLPQLNTLHLPKTTLSADQLAQLTKAFPQLTVEYTTEILGTEYDADTTSLDLSGLTADQISQVTPGLSLLTKLETVELMNGGKSQLAPADVKQLIDAAPHALFNYQFTLFGKTVSTADETVTFSYPKLGNDYEARIREALDILQSCTYFMVDAYKTDSAVMAQIREDYPHIEVVWRVYCGKYSFLTDTEMIRAVYNFYDKDGAELRYCNKVKYIDMGHNTSLSDISFVQYMPELEIMIASGSLVSDLSAYANCKKLEFLELAYCEKITDISPLAHCESLRFLNISFSGVTSLVPLDGLNLERFYYIQNETSQEEEDLFVKIHPDCWTTFSGVGNDPYTKGWRYEDQGKTRSEIYNHIRDVFDLDSVDARIAKQEDDGDE